MSTVLWAKGCGRTISAHFKKASLACRGSELRHAEKTRRAKIRGVSVGDWMRWRRRRASRVRSTIAARSAVRAKATVLPGSARAFFMRGASFAVRGVAMPDSAGWSGADAMPTAGRISKLLAGRLATRGSSASTSNHFTSTAGNSRVPASAAIIVTLSSRTEIVPSSVGRVPSRVPSAYCRAPVGLGMTNVGSCSEVAPRTRRETVRVSASPRRRSPLSALQTSSSWTSLAGRNQPSVESGRGWTSSVIGFEATWRSAPP
jgi:hypothetical protein